MLPLYPYKTWQILCCQMQNTKKNDYHFLYPPITGSIACPLSDGDEHVDGCFPGSVWVEERKNFMVVVFFKYNVNLLFIWHIWHYKLWIQSNYDYLIVYLIPKWRKLMATDWKLFEIGFNLYLI